MEGLRRTFLFNHGSVAEDPQAHGAANLELGSAPFTPINYTSSAVDHFISRELGGMRNHCTRQIQQP